MTVAAVLTAAGVGSRLGAGQPKALVPVAGQALVAWALDRLAQVAPLVVITAPADRLDDFHEAVASVAMGRPALDLRIVAGGDTRQQSVEAGLAAIARSRDDITAVLIHDAARAFQPVVAMEAALGAVAAGADGAVPVVPLVDTLVAAPGDDGSLGPGIDRDSFRAAQTPQVFRWDVAIDAHARAAADGFEGTDDASLARKYGYRVVATEGHPWGFKVTTAGDLALAEHVARHA